MKDYVTTAQAAERLGISTARIRQMIIEGVIKGAEKIGRDNLIPEKEIVRLENTERPIGRPPRRPANKQSRKMEITRENFADIAAKLGFSVGQRAMHNSDNLYFLVKDEEMCSPELPVDQFLEYLRGIWAEQ